MSCVATEASHLSSISRIVASTLDFLTGAISAGVELLAGLLFGSGEEDLVAAAVLAGLGARVADFFSVEIETLGSEVDFSVFLDTDASGDAGGVDSSSWARAKGAPAIRIAARAMMVDFMVLLYGLMAGLRATADPPA